MHAKFLWLLLLLLPVSGSLAAAGSTASQSSELSAEGASLIVAGSVETLAGSANLTVTAVETSAAGTVLVLQGASEAATVSVRLLPEVAAGLSRAVGATVEVVTEASGYALIHAGQLIAYIPNELANSLLHHSGHSQ